MMEMELLWVNTAAALNLYPLGRKVKEERKIDERNSCGFITR